MRAAGAGALALVLALSLAGADAAAEPGAGAARLLPSDAVADLARGFVLERFGAELDGAIIEPVSPPRDLALPAGQVSTRMSLQAGSPASGHLTVLVEAAVTDSRGGQTARSTTVALRVHTQQDVVVAVRELARGSVVGPADVRRERRSAERVTRNAAADPAEVVGKEVVRPFAPGEVVTAAGIARARAIRRGTVVTLLVEGPGFRIVARGIASEDGSIGQTIKVVNQVSRRELAGKVEDERTVRVPF